MEIKKEDPSKVVIIPRPPRCASPDLAPINASAPAATQQNANPAEPNHVPVAPANPVNNQVEGPTEGLAGAPAEEPKSK